MLHILFIEPDAGLAHAIISQLPGEARVSHVTTRDRTLAALRHSYDAAILALGSPGLDGLALCAAMRELSSLPIVTLSSSSDLEQRLQALEAGVDDHLSRPFSTRELWGRLRAHVRRARGELGPGLTTIGIGPLEIDRRALCARLHGLPLPLTSDELSLLRVLAEHPGRVLSRERLLDLLKGSADKAFDRAIDVRVSRLRRKLGADADLIHTVRGIGYTLVSGARSTPPEGGVDAR